MPPSSSPPGALGGKRFKALLIALSVAVYLLLCGFYLARIRHTDGGHLVYALDDPYIHLALADGIAGGHYGINSGEAASPSSSFLWPFLLVPFAHASWFAWAPLLLNLLAGTALAALLGYLVANWPGDPRSWEERVRRLLAVFALLFIGNLVCLTFIGMEHTLQVLLAAVAAYAITRVLDGRPVPLPALVGVALGPAVRYEAVGLALAVAIALAARRQYRAAIDLLAASLAPLVCFSLFLHHLGLPLLPTSVLVKGGVASGGALHHLLNLVGGAVAGAFGQRDRLLLAVLFITLVDLAFQQRDRVRRIALGGAALATGLHLLIGQFNWFHRYEVYIVLFSSLVVLHVLFEQPRIMRGWYALGLLACALPYLDATRTLIGATQDVYLQQYQMHRFISDFYTGNVAVNDLGLASYHRRGDQYVLDLVGLGSAEAAREKNKSAEWLDIITERRHVGLAMIYPQWFDKLPADWTPVGELCLVRQPVMLSQPCVGFYATEAGDPARIEREFGAFAATLPGGVIALPPGASRETRLLPRQVR